MPIRLPDQFHSLREVAALPNTPYRLHMKSLTWCSVNQTGGLITREDFFLVSAGTGASERHAADCERTGAWHEARHDCGSEFCLGPQDADGWVVHDFYRYDVPEEAAEDAVALEKRRAAERERKRRERERKAALSTEPPRKRGRPPKVNKTAKPQVKNTSRDLSRDRITDADRSDLDFDQSLALASQSKSRSKSRAPEAEPGTPEFRIQVQAEMAERGYGDVTDAEADAIAAEVLGCAKDPVPHPLGYVLKAVKDEKNPAARWLSARAPAPAVILAAFSPATKVHDFERNPETGGCARCKEPEPDKIHRTQKAAAS